MPSQETVDALVEMVRELRVSDANQSTQMDLMRPHMDTQVEALSAIGAAMPQRNVVDVGKVGKPDCPG